MVGMCRAVGKAADASHSWATSDANKKGDSKMQWSNSSAEGKKVRILVGISDFSR